MRVTCVRVLQQISLFLFFMCVCSPDCSLLEAALQFERDVEANGNDGEEVSLYVFMNNTCIVDVVMCAK